MRKLLSILFILPALFFSQEISAQKKKNNIARQPVWGPSGFDYVHYYFIPDFDLYYDVPASRFIYLQHDSVWVMDTALPLAYSNADLFSSYKVVINKPKAYEAFKEHQQLYLHLKGNRSQPCIRDSTDPKYFVVKGHPNYVEPKKPAKKEGKKKPAKKPKTKKANPKKTPRDS